MALFSSSKLPEKKKKKKSIMPFAPHNWQIFLAPQLRKKEVKSEKELEENNYEILLICVHVRTLQHKTIVYYLGIL